MVCWLADGPKRKLKGNYLDNLGNILDMCRIEQNPLEKYGSLLNEKWYFVGTTLHMNLLLPPGKFTEISFDGV